MRSLWLAVLWLSLALPASAAELVIAGQVEHPGTLALDDLHRLPPVTVETNFETSHGKQHGVFTGALLWTVLTDAAPIDAPGGRDRLQHTLLARGRDGYAVAVAIGELDPRMEDKAVVVAYAQDGKELDELRLIIPGDHHAGRAVRDLVAIEVR